MYFFKNSINVLLKLFFFFFFFEEFGFKYSFLKIKSSAEIETGSCNEANQYVSVLFSKWDLQCKQENNLIILIIGEALCN